MLVEERGALSASARPTTITEPQKTKYHSKSSFLLNLGCVVSS